MPDANWLVHEAKEALERFDKLPPEEQFRCLIAHGTINEKGEVLMGLKESKEEQK